jgi:SnoaL-like domain
MCKAGTAPVLKIDGNNSGSRGIGFRSIEDDIMMRGKRTTMSHAIPDLMSVNLLRVFNERNGRRRAAAIRAMYAKDCFFADAIESVSGWDAVHDKVDRLHAAHPGFVFQPSGLAIAHHDLACQRWRFGPPDARDAITGIDVAIFEKGFIRALYVFVDGGPSASLARRCPLSV